MTTLTLDGKAIVLLDEASAYTLADLAKGEPGYTTTSVVVVTDSEKIEPVLSDIEEEHKIRLTKTVTATLVMKFIVEREWDESEGVRPSRRNPTMRVDN